ncbi:unnamed protein product [Leptosia nina]|uniref:Lysozyme n=1 Tax=Leptosia nina TaxID=320188 RepID=A0AAV1K0U9_9NEOP
MCSKLTCGIITAVVGLILVVVTCIISFVLVPNLVESIILDEVALANDTEAMQRFQEIPFPLHFKVRVFNITNPVEVRAGAVPDVTEMGPYVYKLFNTREIENFDGDIVKYRIRNVFEFDANASYPYTEDDMVTVVNVPYHGILQMAEKLFPFLMGALSLGMSGVFGANNDPIMTVRVGDFLFDGIPICKDAGLLGGIACTQIRSIGANVKNLVELEDGSLVFTILNYKNNTPTELYEVHRGIEDHTKLGLINLFNGSTFIDNWVHQENDNGTWPGICNMVNGTDSAIYAPFVNRDESVFALNLDICRSVQLKYQYDTEYDGIPVARFAVNEWFLDNHEGCFCLNVTGGITQENGCLYPGAMELYSCVDEPICHCSKMQGSLLLQLSIPLTYGPVMDWWRARGGRSLVKKRAHAFDAQTQIEMFGVALLTSALFALAGARIYERCELARDLHRLGVRKDNIATWVCIAFHESRFDTAARNPNSGDHGLLQISELYWCGPGKACGAPCSAFRDDDIADDVECALQIHEEHTRLQGDGFLAWVVYPHYCKHNAKKYLADCDGSFKETPYKLEDRGRTFKWQNAALNNNAAVPLYKKYPNIDDLKPPSVPINVLLRGIYDANVEDHVKQVTVDVIDTNVNKKHPFEWLNTKLLKTDIVDLTHFKINNIDDLKPPVVGNGNPIEYSTPTTTTTIRTTTVDPELIGIKPPNPRRIETNQFRRRMMSFKNNYVENNDKKNDINESGEPNKTTTIDKSSTTIFTNITKPEMIPVFSFKIRETGSQEKIKNIKDETSSSPNTNFTSETPYLTSKRYYAQNNISTTPSPVNDLLHEQKLKSQEEGSTAKPQSSGPQKVGRKMKFDIDSNKSDVSTTKAQIMSTTVSPTRTTFLNRRRFSYTPQYMESTTNRSTVTRSWNQQTRLTSPLPKTEGTTTRPRMSSPTQRNSFSAQTPATTEKSGIKTSTQSIFDLYLNPTKRPNIVFHFPEFKESPYKIRIFAGGTTTHAPLLTNSRSSDLPKKSNQTSS